MDSIHSLLFLRINDNHVPVWYGEVKVVFGQVTFESHLPGWAALVKSREGMGRHGSNYAWMCVSKSEGHRSFFGFKGVNLAFTTLNVEVAFLNITM